MNAKLKGIIIISILLVSLVSLILFIPKTNATSYEQITNGGFETGDDTGWTPIGMMISISSTEHYSGSYSAETGYSSSLFQDFPPVPQSTIVSFSSWLKAVHFDGANPYRFRITIGYSDAGSTQIDLMSGGDLPALVEGVWTYIDLSSFVTSGKHVESISFGNYMDNWDYVYIDDVTLLSTAPPPGSESPLVSINLNGPADGATLYTKTVTFNFTPVWSTTNYSIENATIYINDMWESEVLYPTLINNTQNTKVFYFSSYGTYSWYVRLFNTTDYIQSSTYTLNLVSASTLNSISLNSPANDLTLNYRTIDFVFTPIWIKGNGEIKNATLYVDGQTGVLEYVEDVEYTVLTNNTQNAITLTVPSYMTYSWYIRLYNSTDYIQSSTYTLHVPPSPLKSIVLDYPTIEQIIIGTKTVHFAFTPIWGTSNGFMKNATLYVASSTHINQSALVNATQNIITLTMANYEAYNWYVRLYNSTGYIQTASRVFTLVSLPPDLQYAGYVPVILSYSGVDNPGMGIDENGYGANINPGGYMIYDAGLTYGNITAIAIKGLFSDVGTRMNLSVSDDGLTWYQIVTNYNSGDADFTWRGFAVGSNRENTRYAMINVTGPGFYEVDDVHFVPQSFAVTITNMDAGTWLFAGDKDYYFAGVYVSYSNYSVYRMAFSDGIHWVNITYNVVTDVGNVSLGRDYAVLRSVIYSKIGDVARVTFPLYLTGDIHDAADVSIYMSALLANGTSASWVLGASKYFNIYNLGGLTEYQTFDPGAENASRIVKGDVFALQVSGGVSGGIQANYTWRNVAAIHMLVHISWPQSVLGSNYAGEWTAEYGVYYYVNGAWVKGWNCKIEQSQGYTSPSDYWVQIHVRWYQKDMMVGSSEYFYSYWSQDPLDETTLYIDLWFGNANASSVGGGRVTAESYGMRNPPAGNIWDAIRHWFGSEDWTPMYINQTYSQYNMPLLGPSGEVVSTQQIQLVKYYAKLYKYASTGSYTMQLKDYTVFDKTFTGKTLKGVNTPTIVETKTPTMPQGGIFLPLVMIFSSVGILILNALISGLTLLINAFIGGLNYLFGLAGWSGGFSQILLWISAFIGFMISGFGYVLTLLYSFFLFLATWLPTMLLLFANLVVGFVGIFGTLLTIWTGMGTVATGVGGFISGLLPLLPLVVFIWLFMSRDFHEMFDKIHLMWSFATSAIDILIKVGDFGVNLIYRIIMLFKGWL